MTVDSFSNRHVHRDPCTTRTPLLETQRKHRLPASGTRRSDPETSPRPAGTAGSRGRPSYTWHGRFEPEGVEGLKSPPLRNGLVYSPLHVFQLLALGFRYELEHEEQGHEGEGRVEAIGESQRDVFESREGDSDDPVRNPLSTRRD